jgi:hypothetical protein
MHTIDTSHLPILILHTADPMSMADAEAIIAAGNELIGRQQPFGLIMATAGGDNKQREKGVNAYMTRWLKDNKPHFERWCAGLATVVPTAPMLALYRPMVKLLGPRMYGCQAEIFTDVGLALQWSQDQLAKGKAA